MEKARLIRRQRVEWSPSSAGIFQIMWMWSGSITAAMMSNGRLRRISPMTSRKRETMAGSWKTGRLPAVTTVKKYSCPG